MWWLAFVPILLGLGGAIWRWGAAAVAACFVLLVLIFQGSSDLYLLPLDYYKDGGDGAFTLQWVWIAHAVFWTAVVLLAVWIGKRLRAGLVR